MFAFCFIRFPAYKQIFFVCGFTNGHQFKFSRDAPYLVFPRLSPALLNNDYYGIVFLLRHPVADNFGRFLRRPKKKKKSKQSLPICFYKGSFHLR